MGFWPALDPRTHSIDLMPTATTAPRFTAVATGYLGDHASLGVQVIAGAVTSRHAWPMPEIIGEVVVRTVSDAKRSAAWYCDLLGAQETSRYVQPEGHVALVHLGELRSGVELCLVDHGADPGTFTEFRAGLDHLEFLVAERSDLDAWAARLDELGIRHSGVKEPFYTANSMLTFRDPDNIQLEFFWRAQSQSSPENRSHAACLDTPSAWPMRVQLMPRPRKMATWSCTAASTCDSTA